MARGREGTVMELLVFYIPSFVITLSWWCLLGNQKETENKKKERSAQHKKKVQRCLVPSVAHI